MKHLICINQGHGGTDPGACAGAEQEKYLALEIAQKLRAELQRRGFSVCMTRESDFYNTPKQKAQFANSKGAEIFVSIHCNAAENQTAHGTETLSYGLSGESYRLAEAIQREVVAAWKAAGEKALRDLGLTTEPHDPEEVVDFDILGTIVNKLQDRLK